MGTKLDGKVAPVTGVGRGIGRAIALAYGQHGAAVGCVARTLHEIRGTADEIVRGGGRARAVAADVGDGESVQRAFDERPEDVVRLALFLAEQPDRGPTAQSFSLMRRDG